MSHLFSFIKVLAIESMCTTACVPMLVFSIVIAIIPIMEFVQIKVFVLEF